MKRTVILIIIIVFMLSSCGKSQEVKNVENRIDSIGEVTLDSLDLLNDIKAEYRALSFDDRKKVYNYNKLDAAISKYDNLMEEEKKKKQMDAVTITAESVAKNQNISDISCSDIIYSSTMHEYDIKFTCEECTNMSNSELLHFAVDIRSAIEQNESGDTYFSKISGIWINDWETHVLPPSSTKLTPKAWMSNSDGSFYEENLSRFNYTERKTSENAGRTCPNCGGSGIVKFYYGASAIEAALNGKDDYELGDCPMCRGTGTVND